MLIKGVVAVHAGAGFSRERSVSTTKKHFVYVVLGVKLSLVVWFLPRNCSRSRDELYSQYLSLVVLTSTQERCKLIRKVRVECALNPDDDDGQAPGPRQGNGGDDLDELQKRVTFPAKDCIGSATLGLLSKADMAVTGVGEGVSLLHRLANSGGFPLWK